MSTELVPSKTIPKIYKSLTDLSNKEIAEQQSINLLKIGISNLNKMNPKYVAIAANMIFSGASNEDLYSKRVFMNNIDQYSVYNGKTIYEYLNIMFGIDEDQHDLIIQHLEMLLSYTHSILGYLTLDMTQFKEEIFEEFEEEVEEEEFEEDD